MTNEEQLQDLKQFIEAAVSQSEQRLEERIDSVEMRMATKDHLALLEARMATKDDVSELRQDIGTVDNKLDIITEAIGEAHQAGETRLDDHEDRLRRLERRTV